MMQLQFALRDLSAKLNERRKLEQRDVDAILDQITALQPFTFKSFQALDAREELQCVAHALMSTCNEEIARFLLGADSDCALKAWLTTNTPATFAKVSPMRFRQGIRQSAREAAKPAPVNRFQL